MSAAESFRAAVADFGFNLCGVLNPTDYDVLVPAPFQTKTLKPDARTVLVVGSGGRALWHAIGMAPERGMTHRIDAFTERVVTHAAYDHLPGARLLWPWTTDDGAYAPFMALAQAAGLGVPSRMRMLIHPVYGLWTGIRAVVIADADPPALAADTAADFDPCVTCHGPCVRVCHGNAVGKTALDGDKCLRTRVRLPACRNTCDARLACPVGTEHRYSAEQLAHHSRRLLRSGAFARHVVWRARQRFSS